MHRVSLHRRRRAGEPQVPRRGEELHAGERGTPGAVADRLHQGLAGVHHHRGRNGCPVVRGGGIPRGNQRAERGPEEPDVPRRVHRVALREQASHLRCGRHRCQGTGAAGRAGEAVRRGGVPHRNLRRGMQGCQRAADTGWQGGVAAGTGRGEGGAAGGRVHRRRCTRRAGPSCSRKGCRKEPCWAWATWTNC